jgi:hypothetical protein
MTNYKFKKAARANRAKAVFFTIAFHIALFGAVAYSTDADVKSYLPDAVKDLIGMHEELPEKEQIRP